MSDFDELKKLAEAATPGPWETDEKRQVFAQSVGEYVAITKIEEFDPIPFEQGAKDAVFIAAANPRAVLDLIELAEQRQNRIHELAAQANRLKDEVDVLRKDAERYRFIRNREHEDNLHAIIMYRNRAANTQCIVGGQQADAVIDNLIRDML